MKFTTLFGRGSAVAACGLTLGYTMDLLAASSYLSTTQYVLAGAGVATAVFGAITVGEDVLREVIPTEN